MSSGYQPKITIFYCINAFNEKAALPVVSAGLAQWTYVKMACSSMVKDVFILKAFESGMDGVMVFVCPEEACRYVEGSIRAAKRVYRVKEILNEIGLGSDRLSIFNMVPGDADRMETALKEAADRLSQKGPLFTTD
jgi:coenzyme F420-reducing hydrogenase delta subunit